MHWAYPFPSEFKSLHEATLPATRTGRCRCVILWIPARFDQQRCSAEILVRLEVVDPHHGFLLPHALNPGALPTGAGCLLVRNLLRVILVHTLHTQCVCNLGADRSVVARQQFGLVLGFRFSDATILEPYFA